MKATFALVLILAITSPALSAEFTTEQCVSILTGLNALNCAGQQLGGTCEPGAKQYKLGPARFTIALAVAALGPVFASAQRAQQDYIGRELPPISGKPDDPATALARAKQQTLAQKNWTKIMAAPCAVAPGHLKLTDLKLGDGPDDNAVPPAVLGAIAPIIDKDK